MFSGESLFRDTKLTDYIGCLAPPAMFFKSLDNLLFGETLFHVFQSPCDTLYHTETKVHSGSVFGEHVSEIRYGLRQG